MYYSKITGTGAYLPKKVLTNYDLEKQVDTTHDWIVERTGITQRHIISNDETTTSMAHEAAKEALSRANINPADLDLIIVATCTPEYSFPSTACLLQGKLKATKAGAFDVGAACAGFIYGLTIADQFIKSGQAKHVLVVGSESLTKLLDWSDRSTCVLFGDGAGAVILSASDQPGIIASELHADGSHAHILYRKHLEVNAPIHMQGREVFRQAVDRLVESCRSLLTKANMTPEDIDWVVPHQANLRIIRMVMAKLKKPKGSVIVTVDRHANTSAASIPLALHEGVTSGDIKPGQTLMLEGIGGGLAWGGCIIKY